MGRDIPAGGQLPVRGAAEVRLPAPLQGEGALRQGEDARRQGQGGRHQRQDGRGQGAEHQGAGRLQVPQEGAEDRHGRGTQV